MTHRVLGRFLWMFSLLILLAAGCDDASTGGTQTGGDAGPADATHEVDAPDADSPDTTPPIQCTPSEIVRCTQENTPGIARCNAAGDELVEGSCAAGNVCRDARCVPVTCVPGTARCDSLTLPQRCAEDGSAWVDQPACSGEQLCEEGFCLDRCGVAEATRSYIGCEYWAVELENHMLDSDDTPPELNDMRAPFAIVLANPSETYDTEISVFIGPDEFAQAIPSRLVETTSFPGIPVVPGIDLQTVYSEVVSLSGRRILGPISGDIDRIPLPRGSMMTLILPFRGLEFGWSTLAQKAYRVQSTQPVVAYQFNPICCNYSHTNDASLLLPTSVLTPNYMFMSYAVLSNGDTPFSPTLTVMATEPDTQVRIQLNPPHPNSSGRTRPFGELLYPFDAAALGRVSGPDETGVLSLTLQPFEVLNLAGSAYAPAEDLTGSLIEASAPVAVFGGHTCAYVPFTLGFCDHLETQLFPLETWGQRFVVAALKLRQPAEQAEHSREGTYWKFLAREDQTEINVGRDITPPAVQRPVDEGVAACVDFAPTPADAAAGRFVLNAGQTCEFGTRDVFVAESSHPIMIGAFLSGQVSVSPNATWGTHAGDPSFFLVPPEEQYRSTYDFLTPPTYHQSYVTVTGYPGMQITLDGELVDLADADFLENTRRGVARAHIPLGPGPHKIQAPLPFGIVVYGYDDYVSYAYTGGLDFKKLTPWR